MPRLTLKTKLVLAITGMVLALVLALSCIYVSQLIDQRLTEADANAEFVAHQVLEAARKPLEAVPIPAPDASDDASDDTARMHLAMAAVLQSDAGLNSLLQSVDRLFAHDLRRLHRGQGQPGGAAQRRRPGSTGRCPSGPISGD